MDWQERKRNKQKIQMKEVKRKHNVSSQHSQLFRSQCLTVAHNCFMNVPEKERGISVLLLETEHKTQNYRKNGNCTEINVIIFHVGSAQLRLHSTHIRPMMTCLCILYSTTNNILIRIKNNDEGNCLN